MAIGLVVIIIAEDERGGVHRGHAAGRERDGARGAADGQARGGVVEEDVREGADAIHAVGARGRGRGGEPAQQGGRTQDASGSFLGQPVAKWSTQNECSKVSCTMHC